MKLHTVSTLSGASVIVALSASPALGADYIGDAASALQSGSIYVDSPLASISNESKIEGTFSGSGVGIAVFADDASGTFTPVQLAGQIRQSTGLDTVVVIVGGSKFGVSSKGDSTALTQGLYTSYGQTGDAGAAVLENAEALTAAKTVTSTEQPKDSGDGGGVPWGGIVGGGSILLLLAAGAAGFTMFKKRAQERKREELVSAHVLDSIPADLKLAITTLEGLIKDYRARGDVDMANNITNILGHTNQLFTRIKKKNAAGAQSAEIKYTDVLKKLTMALSPDYYMDIRANPTLWPNPQQRILEVEEAVKNTDNQILANIRQVNSNEDLEIKVALGSLTKSLDDTPSLGNIFKE